MPEFTRNCPQCSKIMMYSTYDGMRCSTKAGALCVECRDINRVPNQLSQIQIEFLTGLLLGDGCIQYGSIRAKNPRLVVNRKLDDIDYLVWQFEIFKDFYKTNGPTKSDIYDKRTNKIYHHAILQSKSSSIFKLYREKWYSEPNKIKIIPKDLILTPLTLLIWFLDDGCVVNSSKNGLIFQLSTDGFLKEDVEFLAILLSSFINERVNICRNKEKFFLRGYTPSTLSLISIIDDILPECMSRKRTWKEYDFCNKHNLFLFYNYSFSLLIVQ
jgi:hypothetical protein